VPAEDEELLVAAAWLHDIGYAPALVDTGFHQLDGARYLRRIGAPERLCRLVAHHTASPVEATGRGLRDELMREFPEEQSVTADALTFADMTTGPDGSSLTALERLTEILARYPEGHVVHASITRATPQLLATVARVEARLATTPSASSDAFDLVYADDPRVVLGFSNNGPTAQRQSRSSSPVGTPGDRD
jgi:hypothetical protein